MADTLIISDLHLSQDRPATVDLFLRFLQEQAVGAGALYILGDLFDAWIGDDNDSPAIVRIIEALRQFADSDRQLLVMHGNRDFLLGTQFAEQAGCKLLPDPYTCTLGGIRTLLMHGDLLCSDDLEYQEARKLLRSPAFIKDFVSRPIEQRIQLAAEYRKRSGEVVSLKPADIMDVNQQTVERYMRENGTHRLIHGHTHRPALHQFELDGSTAERHVLEDWQEQSSSYLRIATSGQITRENFG